MNSKTKATLKWLGQMGLLIEFENIKLCIDYYASPDEGRQTPPPIPAEELRGIDVFLGTHDHLDHIDHASWRIWAASCPDARFVFPEAHRQAVLSDGVKCVIGNETQIRAAADAFTEVNPLFTS